MNPSSLATTPINIVYRPISALKLNPTNPRLHNTKQVQQIANSIMAFGFNVPILVDAQLQVIAGHGRLLACQKLGWTQVPTICLSHLTEPQTKAFLIADNKLTENAAWDEDLLAQHLKDLSILNLDFDIEVTGFETAAIDLLIEGLEKNQNSDPDDDYIPATANQALSCPGDLWLLNQHRLYCGDSLKDSSYIALMKGQKAAIIFADPPYNVPIQGHVGGRGAIKHREFAMAAGEMSPAEFVDFLTQSLTQLAKNSTDGSIHYICMDWRHVNELLQAGHQAYTEFKNLCVWVKDNAGMGSFYRSRHELIFVFKNGKAPHRNNFLLGQHGRYRTNVWEYPGTNALTWPGQEGSLLEFHPTVKPIALVADALRDCSARGDIVLDNFLGSGTTLLAAERTGRICYGLELDPGYIDVTIQRWQKLTGQAAIHEKTGLTFDELTKAGSSYHD